MKACRNTRRYSLAHFNIEKQLKGSAVESEKSVLRFTFLFLRFLLFLSGFIQDSTKSRQEVCEKERRLNRK